MAPGPRRLLPLVTLALAAVAWSIAPAFPPGGVASAAAQSSPRWPDGAAYALDLSFDRRRATLRGAQQISFTNTSTVPLRSVWLRTWANAFGGCAARRARVQIISGGTAGERRRRCTALEVRLNRPVAPGERTELRLRIRVTAPRRADRFGRYRGAAYFGNALPILAVGDARGVLLPPYTFAGESFYSLTSSWQVRLRLPPRLRVASTGVETARRGRTVTLTAPRARDFALVVGRFRVDTARAGEIGVRRFSFPGTPATEIRRALRAAQVSLPAFERWYGPYGRPEVDLVDGPRELASGGLAMEYPELVMTPPDASTIAHELAHQWFYAIVGNDQWSDPWLDESFAEFSASRLPYRRFPNRLAHCRIPDGRRVPLNADMGVMVRGRNRYVNVVYIGGACLLRALQRTLGDAQFDAMMLRVVAEHRDGVITTPEFVAALHDAAEDDAAVDSLLRRAGIPA